MRFQSIRVENLRAVREFRVDDLKDFVVIAGPNGCGKSCVFDAIRLLKSLYGGYQANEHMHWFTELGITPQNRMAMRNVFRDPSRPVEIEAVLSFSDDEKAYMLEDINELAWPIAWQHATGQIVDYWTFSRVSVAQQVAQYRDAVKPVIDNIKEEILKEFEQDTVTISLVITPDGEINVTPCRTAQVSFGAFEPERLGIIEYHSAARTYVRQPLQGINLDARTFDDQRRQYTLYNSQAKYQNVKTELASGYLRALIRQRAGGEPDGEDLNETLKELFQTFFPDKSYLGVQAQPHGGLEFPVVLPGGERHDIDDLSSGEKEIVYGYLRLRNSTPMHSVLLLDEPELHLNPSLLQGFTDFYYRHLGVARDNQLWLVTHSDALLRQAIGNSNYRVYHMQSATASNDGNQASEILLDSDAERVTVELVGDLAAYRPHAKVVILEGVNADAFDELMIRRLFPDFARRVNLVSGGSKRRVSDLWDVLRRSAERAGLKNRFFAILDRDSDNDPNLERTSSTFVWDRYHIENYLLDSRAIRQASQLLTGGQVFANDGEVTEALRACARDGVDDVVLHRLTAELNNEVIGKITIGGKLRGKGVAAALSGSIAGSVERVNKYASTTTAASIELRAQDIRGRYLDALESDAWLREFPGREMLRRFAHQHLGDVKYETFRNAVLDKMQQADAKPEAMVTVFGQILSAS